MKKNRLSLEEFEAMVRKAAPSLKHLVDKPPDVSPENISELKKKLERIHPFLRLFTPDQMREVILRLLEKLPMDGVEITSRLRQANMRLKDAGDGEIYGLLRELENSGKVTAEMKESSNRMRRVYRITEMGRVALKQSTTQEVEVNNWVELLTRVSLPNE
jgi:DNA-binding PadR family transcriptional regulator